jgi:hypothetical protein
MIILRVKKRKEKAMHMHTNYLIKIALKISLSFIIIFKFSLYFCKMIKITLSSIMFSMRKKISNLKKKSSALS